MKKRFINNSSNLIISYHPEFDQDKIDEIKYGLEALYLTTTKLIIIFGIAIYFNIFKETVLMLISLNIFRSTAYGIHATSSFKCLIFTGAILLIPAFLVNKITFDITTKCLVSILCIIAYYLYAPADTEKFPLIKKEKRDKLRFKTVLKSIIVSCIILFLNSQVLVKLLTVGMIVEAIMILPITYKIFGQPYANYKTYLSNK